MRSGPAVAACALLLGAVTLAACTGSSTSSSSTSPAGRVAAGAAHAAYGPSSGGTTVQVGTTRLAPQLVIRGSLSVQVSSVARAAGRAEAIAAAAGGRTDSDDRAARRGGRPRAQLTLRVPDSAVPGVVDRLAALGRPTERRLSTRDVTTQVADVASRVASARAAIASLRALYARATRVGDVIRIESVLAGREASLESLEARRSVLAGQVALASLTLDLVQRAPTRPAAARTSPPSGFVGGLERGWHAFTTAAAGLATAFGAALPFLLVLALIGVLAVVVRRRLRPGTAVARRDD